MTLEKAVALCSELDNHCFCRGLRALGGNSKRLKPREPRKVRGSVDFDRCLSVLYPNAPRWDYGVDYDGAVYYVEVHRGHTRSVDEVLAKLAWFKGWKKKSCFGPVSDEKGYWWVATGGVWILPNARYRRKIAQSGLRGPVAVLKLPPD